MSSGAKMTDRSFKGIWWRSKHTQYNKKGQPIGSETHKGKRAKT